MKKTYYFDVDGVLADFHSAYVHSRREEFCTYEYIRNLKPFVENVALVKSLIAEGNRVYISTKVANVDTQRARIEWLAEYLPEIPKYRVITILGNEKKCDKMRTKDGILVDDKKENCRQWEKSGRQAILVTVKGGRIPL